MLLSRRLAAVLAALILIFALQASAFAAISVIPEPGTDPARVALVQKTVDAFNDIVGAGMGATLDRDVRVFVCPTVDSYRGVLIRELGLNPAMADRLSKSTSGMSGGTKNAIVINFTPPPASSSGQRTYLVTAHELFHQLEYQLAANKMGKSFYWLKEGAADLLGAAVAEKVGYQSLDKWKLDRINILRRADKHVSPQEILITNLDRWTALSEQKLHPYEMSDLMVFYLMNEAKTGGYRAIGEYYRLLGQGAANAAAFQQAFGISPDTMVAGFQSWFAVVSTQAATIEVIAGPDVPAVYLDDFNRGADLSRKFFTATWGRDVQNSMRFVLVSGKDAFAAAAVKEFGVSPVQAAQTVKTATWWFSGSTTIYDIKSYPAPRQRIAAVASSLARRFGNEAAPQASLHQLYWLTTGASDAVAALIVEQSGAATADFYRSAWLNSLAKLPALPALAELATPAGSGQAKARYGVNSVNQLGSLAALYLLDTRGPATLGAWFTAVKNTGSAESGFQQAFGITVAQFYDEFAAYLSQNLRKAS